MKKSGILFALLLAGIFSACSATEKSGGNQNENALAGTAHNQAIAESNQTNINAKQPAPAKQTDIFSGFKREADYKTEIRPQIVKAGWEPARSEDGDMNCEGGGKICQEYPELDAGPSSPAGDAIFRWKKGDKVVKIFTYDNQVYNRYEFEKSAPGKTTDISGKYSYRYTEDYGGEISFVFKDKNKLDYEWAQEDVTWKGDGNWSWSEGKQTLTATVFTEPDVQSAAESENTPPRKEVFVFRKTGNVLKLTAPPSGMDAYKDKVFQKK